MQSSVNFEIKISINQYGYYDCYIANINEKFTVKEHCDIEKTGQALYISFINFWALRKRGQI